MRATLLVAGLLLAATAIALVPSATAIPNCEVDTNTTGVGVGCNGGPNPLNFCVLVLYNTYHVNWGTLAGEYGCV
jgi:hypothetical protein